MAKEAPSFGEDLYGMDPAFSSIDDIEDTRLKQSSTSGSEPFTYSHPPVDPSGFWNVTMLAIEIALLPLNLVRRAAARFAASIETVVRMLAHESDRRDDDETSDTEPYDEYDVDLIMADGGSESPDEEIGLETVEEEPEPEEEQQQEVEDKKPKAEEEDPESGIANEYPEPEVVNEEPEESGQELEPEVITKPASRGRRSRRKSPRPQRRVTSVLRSRVRFSNAEYFDVDYCDPEEAAESGDRSNVIVTTRNVEQLSRVANSDCDLGARGQGSESRVESTDDRSCLRVGNVANSPTCDVEEFLERDFLYHAVITAAGSSESRTTQPSSCASDTFPQFLDDDDNGVDIFGGINECLLDCSIDSDFDVTE